MRKLIKIKDVISRDGCSFLTVTLRDLLGDLEPFAVGLYWMLYEFDAFANPKKIISGYADLVNKVDNSEIGCLITWRELIQLAESLDQVVNLMLIASDRKDNFVKCEDMDEYGTKYNVILEIVDGDYWEVYSSDEKLIAFLENKYNDTEVSVAE